MQTIPLRHMINITDTHSLRNTHLEEHSNEFLIVSPGSPSGCIVTQENKHGGRDLADLGLQGGQGEPQQVNHGAQAVGIHLQQGCG